MPWLVKFQGEELNTEDLTLDELEAVQKATASATGDITPWILLNPVEDMAVAKAFLALSLVKSGLEDDVARSKVGALTLREIKGAFEFIQPGADLPTQYVDGQPDPKAAPEEPTSGSSGPGGTSDGLPT